MGLIEEQQYAYLYGIMKETRRNKRRGRDSVEFEANWAPLLVRAMDARNDRTLRIIKNYAFLTPHPRWREIFATEAGGRMIDHEVCDVVIPEAEAVLSPYTYNNRKGKGSQAAINQLLEHIYEASCGFTAPVRIVKIDFSGFFPNALWDIMDRVICQVVDNADIDDERKSYIKWLTMISVHCNPADHCELRTPSYLWSEHIPPEKSLRMKPEGVGAPIGRLICQTGMGLYINDEIIWLTEECGLRLVCFVDDIVFVVPEEQHGYLLALLPELRRRLAMKGVRLNERKFYDQPYRHGCEFLGSHIRPNRIHLNKKTYDNAIRAIEKLNASHYKNIDKMVQCFNSYGGMLKGRTDFRRLCELRDHISPEWSKWLGWDERRKCLTYLPGFTPNERLDRKYHLHLKVKRHDKTRNPRTKEHCSESHVRCGGAPYLH